MKTALAALTGVLYNINVQKVKELYTFEFGSGTKTYWTTAEGAVVSGTTTWNPFYINRGQSRSATGVEVGTMDLTLYPGATTLDGVTMPLAATQGAFDSARVKIERSYTNASGTLYSTLFDGMVVDVQPASTYVRLTVKSGMAKLDIPFPPRVIQAQCSWQLYDIMCGVNPASFTTSLNAISGSTTTSINTSAIQTNYFQGGLLTFTSGPLNGVSRSVTANSTESISVFPSLPYVPSAGDSFTVRKGCNKTRTTCKDVFNNKANFGGFADVPAPEK